MKYSVKILIRHAVETGEAFIEESIILLDADTFDEAYLKAEKYAEENEICESYKNMAGKWVKSEVLSLVDCFAVYEDEDVTEVYSSIIRCRNDLPEASVLAFFKESCSRKELLPLRQWADPEHPEEAD